MIDRLSGLYEDSSRFLFFPFSLDVVLFFFGGKDVMVVCQEDRVQRIGSTFS